MRLANKVAIVTGGSSGIGRSCARLFAEEGARVAIAADINVAGGNETAAAVKKRGGEAIFVRADVSVASEVENLVRETVDAFGSVDVLVNNAGVFAPPAPVEDLAETTWDHLYAVNAKGVFLMTKYVVPVMKKSGGGVIVNIGSMGAVRPGAFTTAYVSSKGAVVTLTKALAKELAPSKIRVNCVNPVLTETRIADSFPAEVKNHITGNIPLGRMAKPDEVAWAVLFLASDEAAMLTGASLNVDGGFSI